MMMNRRTFTTILAASLAATLNPRVARAGSRPAARNVVLVHGLFADGSSWSEVIPRLQAAGLNVTSVQNPLTTLDDAVAETQRVLSRQDGPTVLVGHSFSGMIVTEAGVDPKVTAVVYVAARAPDAGEDYSALASTFPTPPASAGIVFDGDEGRLTEAAFLRDFAGDLPETRARAALRRPAAVSQGATRRKDHTRRVAFETELLCRVHARPDHQSRPSAFHGQAHGRDDDRGQREPSLAHFAPAGDRQPDRAGGRASLSRRRTSTAKRSSYFARSCPTALSQFSRW